jgi:hypothetical protein
MLKFIIPHLNRTNFLSMIGMNPNTILASHVATELVIISGLSFYFHRKCKSQESIIQALQTKLDEQDKKINNLYAQIQLLDKDISGLARDIKMNNEAPARRPPSTPQFSSQAPQQDDEELAFQMAQQMMAQQQRARMMQMQQQAQRQPQPQQPIPQQQSYSNEQDGTYSPMMQPKPQPEMPMMQPTEVKQVRVVGMPPGGMGGLPPIGMPMFPVNALFGMMNYDAPNPNNQPPVVVEEEAEEDLGDVSEELASLNNVKQSQSSN